MSRDQFIAMIERAILAGWITTDQGIELVRRFDAGDLAITRVIESPAPDPTLELFTVDSLAGAAVALLALAGAVDLARATDAQTRAIANQLQDRFEREARSIAARYAGTGDVRGWQNAMTELILTHFAQQGLVGGGLVLSTEALDALRALVATQIAALDRLTEEQIIRALIDAPLSVPQVGARSILLAGGALGIMYVLWEKRAEPVEGWVVEYLALDDGRTCAPCLDAERNGPYLIGSAHPVPGSVCLGGGFCRCALVRVFDPAAYRRLAGIAA